MSRFYFHGRQVRSHGFRIGGVLNAVAEGRTKRRIDGGGYVSRQRLVRVGFSGVRFRNGIQQSLGVGVPGSLLDGFRV